MTDPLPWKTTNFSSSVPFDELHGPQTIGSKSTVPLGHVEHAVYTPQEEK